MTDLIVWRESWLTDIPDIDQQHITMTNKLNQIIDLLNHLDINKNCNKKLEKLLLEFLNLTSNHFASEEALMRQADYPDYSVHKKEHMILHGDLVQYIHDIKCDKSTIESGVLSALKHWFIAHITGDDKAFAIYYNNIIEGGNDT
jgi:hemerythrin-like metal-binding protein